jgi:hypothetical protein
MYQLSLILVLLTSTISGIAQSCNQKAPPGDVKKMAALIGDWQGEFTNEKETLRVFFKFYEDDQELKVRITNTAQASWDIIADASLCSTNKFHFFGQRVNGESFAYNARLVNGELIGDLRIGDSCSKENRNTFKLQKVKL